MFQKVYTEVIIIYRLVKMVRKYKRLEKPYNDATLKVAMDEIAAGASIKATS